MLYRRFGQTEISMPVLSCGGMRYQQSWEDIDPKDLDAANQENIKETIQKSLDSGINHIETARGYGSSEYQLGFILSQLPRDEIIVQTKVGPQSSEAEFLATFEKSLSLLQLEHVDLLSIHGLNTQEVIDQAFSQGALKACRKIRREGRARHIGFSTHGPTDAIEALINTGEFAYVNLHWYFTDPRNWPAIEAATRQDMGVFIISPSDKGGKLYDPSEKLTQLCAPLTPMGFNDLFCLSHPQVHTLSLGVARPSDFDAHLDIIDKVAEADQHLAPIQARLAQALTDALGQDWAARWHINLPWLVDAPNPIPVYQIVRMYTMLKAYDMLSFGKMRYNLIGNGGHWFPGEKPTQIDDAMLLDGLADYPFAEAIPDIIRETHALLNEEDQKRQSES